MQVGYTMPWTALSSELGYLKSLHGANVLLFLNIAYFAPSLPILVTQLVRTLFPSMSPLSALQFLHLSC